MQHDYHTPVVQSVRDFSVQCGSLDELVRTTLRAEQLLPSIQLTKRYSCGELYGRLTGRKDNPWNGAKILGRHLQRDLLRLIEELSEQVVLPVERVGERVFTCEQLAEQFRVSTKTISRWRRTGLVGRRFVMDGRRRIGFLESSVRQFVSRHRELVERAGRFRHLSAQERDRLTELYHRFAEQTHVEALRQAAQQVGCSIETARQVVKNHRIERIASLPLEFVYSDEFEEQGAEQRILAPPPEDQQRRKCDQAPVGLPAYLTSLYDTPLLTAAQERHLFRKFNFLKYRASRLRDRLDRRRPDLNRMERIEALYEQVVATKNQIIRSNLRLVVSLAKSRVSEIHDFYTLISDGNISLIRAVEKFDYSRGFKFSTYATWAIVKNFARSIPDELRRRRRMGSLHDDMLGLVEDDRGDQFDSERHHQRQAQQVHQLLAHLSDREQRIIACRFGLDYRREPQTLREIGEELGVTKERVRQLESRAMRKLRDAATREQIDLL